MQPLLVSLCVQCRRFPATRGPLSRIPVIFSPFSACPTAHSLTGTDRCSLGPCFSGSKLAEEFRPILKKFAHFSASNGMEQRASSTTSLSCKLNSQDHAHHERLGPAPCLWWKASHLQLRPTVRLSYCFDFHFHFHPFLSPSFRPVNFLRSRGQFGCA